MVSLYKGKSLFEHDFPASILRMYVYVSRQDGFMLHFEGELPGNLSRVNGSDLTSLKNLYPDSLRHERLASLEPWQLLRDVS